MALRAVLAASLAFALWRSIAASRGGSAIKATSQTLDASLLRAMSERGAASLTLAITGTPGVAQRGVLAALRHSGMPVTWSGDVAPMALEVVRGREPGDASDLLVAGAPASVALSDSAGVLDTLKAGWSRVSVGALVGSVGATSGHTTARAGVPGAAPRRAVMVLGRADWEIKFVMAALNEAGWLVRARIPAAPGVDVHDDALFPLDTARYDAVVALDTTATDLAPAIARFVAEGGGLVASGAALDIPAFHAMAPASASARIPGRILLTEDTVTRRDLPVTPLISVRNDAVALERQPNGMALAARRTGNGRMLAVGYDESWRWRMLGGTSGLAAHREWWSRAVASVSAERADSAPAGMDAAPRVAVLNDLGPLSDVREMPQGAPGPGLPLWLLVVAVTASLVEIASRRLRGER